MSNKVSAFIRDAWKVFTKQTSNEPAPHENETVDEKSYQNDQPASKVPPPPEKIGGSTAGAMSSMKVDVDLVKKARIADGKLQEITYALKIIHERLLESTENETPLGDTYLHQDLEQLSALEAKLNTLEYVDKDRVLHAKERLDVIKNRIQALLNPPPDNGDDSDGGGGGVQNIKKPVKPPSMGQI